MIGLIKIIASMLTWMAMIADCYMFQDVSREIAFGVTAILLVMPDERGGVE